MTKTSHLTLWAETRLPWESLLKWSFSSATNNLMHGRERGGGGMTISDSLHSPVLIGTLIFTALCDFLLSCLLRWCDFTFCLSKYHREISCKQGDMTFLQAEFRKHA